VSDVDGVLIAVQQLLGEIEIRLGQQRGDELLRGGGDGRALGVEDLGFGTAVASLAAARRC
jgi:hypothetical protein